MDWQEEATNWEFYACREYFQSQGYETIVIDPKAIKYADGLVTAGGREIHLVYRRLLGEDWGAKQKETRAFTQAYAAHRLCVVGSPRSQIAFSKKLFYYLRRPEMLALYSPKMRRTILRTVPWTVPWEKNFAPAEFQNKTLSSPDFIYANKDLFVLKPCVSKCGFGIVQGLHVSETEWRKALKDALDKDFIIQEFIPLETAHFPIHGKCVEYEKRYLHAGVYLFNGKFSGFFGRTCKDPLLCLRHGERMLPILWKKQNAKK